MKHQTITEFTETYTGRPRTSESAAEKPLTAADVNAAVAKAAKPIVETVYHVVGEVLAALPDNEFYRAGGKVMADRLDANDPTAASRAFWGSGLAAPTEQEG